MVAIRDLRRLFVAIALSWSMGSSMSIVTFQPEACTVPGVCSLNGLRYLTEVLGMNCWHLRWVPRTLTPAPKLTRTELAQSML
jgi:hypothetical protein